MSTLKGLPRVKAVCIPTSKVGIQKVPERVPEKMPENNPSPKKISDTKQCVVGKVKRIPQLEENSIAIIIAALGSSKGHIHGSRGQKGW